MNQHWLQRKTIVFSCIYDKECQLHERRIVTIFVNYGVLIPFSGAIEMQMNCTLPHCVHCPGS